MYDTEDTRMTHTYTREGTRARSTGIIAIIIATITIIIIIILLLLLLLFYYYCYYYIIIRKGDLIRLSYIFVLVVVMSVTLLLSLITIGIRQLLSPPSNLLPNARVRHLLSNHYRSSLCHLLLSLCEIICHHFCSLLRFYRIYRVLFVIADFYHCPCIAAQF